MSAKQIETVNGHTLQKVFLSVEDHIAVMTLHNPPVNAADGVVQEEILLLCDYINHEDDIWVCVMHSDIKTFCVGVDVKRFYQSILDKDVTNTQEIYYDGAQALYELRVPLICAVHGHCLGGGLCPRLHAIQRGGGIDHQPVQARIRTQQIGAVADD